MAHEGKQLTLRAGVLQPLEGHTREEVRRLLRQQAAILPSSQSDLRKYNAEPFVPMKTIFVAS